MIKYMLLALCAAISFSSNAQVLGKLKCSWNESEDSCIQNGCLWDDSGCLSFSNSDYSHLPSLSPDLGLSLMRQRIFAAKTRLVTRPIINLRYSGERARNQGIDVDETTEPVDFKPLNYFYKFYSDNGYVTITSEMTKKTAGDPDFSFSRLSLYQQAMIFYPLLAPKTTKSTTLYRGIRAWEKATCDDMIRHPRRFVSTSWSRATAEGFATGKIFSSVIQMQENCLLKIELPEGFPFLDMTNYDPAEPFSSAKHGESEILLPSHVLDAKGNLVPISFEIISKHLEGSISVYTVKPIDILRPKNTSLMELKNFEKKYVSKLCELAPQFGHEALVKMCAMAKDVLHLPLTGWEDFTLHPTVSGSFQDHCHDCELMGDVLTCSCDYNRHAQADLTACATNNFYYSDGNLHCSLPLPATINLSKNSAKDCSYATGHFSCLGGRTEQMPNCSAPRQLVRAVSSWSRDPYYYCSDPLPEGPYQKVCGLCQFNNGELSCNCPSRFPPNKTKRLGEECHDKQIAFEAEEDILFSGKFICVDKTPLPKGEYSDCGCYLDQDTIHCSCPYKGFGRRTGDQIRESSLKVPCHGNIRIHHRVVVCSHGPENNL